MGGYSRNAKLRQVELYPLLEKHKMSTIVVIIFIVQLTAVRNTKGAASIIPTVGRSQITKKQCTSEKSCAKLLGNLLVFSRKSFTLSSMRKLFAY